MRKIVEAKLRGDSHIVAWGTGGASREFLYVDDAAEAIALATERYDDPAPVNIGAGREITIRELAQTIARLCNFQARSAGMHPSRTDSRAGCWMWTRAKECFGFQASTDFEQGLRATIEWFLATQRLQVPARRRRSAARGAAAHAESGSSEARPAA